MICCYPPSQHVPPNIGIDQYPSCCTGLWDGFQMIYGDCRVWERNNLTENRLALWFITIFPHQNVHLGMSSPFSDTRIILSWLQLTVGYMCVYIYIDSKNSLFNPPKKVLLLILYSYEWCQEYCSGTNISIEALCWH